MFRIPYRSPFKIDRALRSLELQWLGSSIRRSFAVVICCGLEIRVYHICLLTTGLSLLRLTPVEYRVNSRSVPSGRLLACVRMRLRGIRATSALGPVPAKNSEEVDEVVVVSCGWSSV